MCGIALVLSSDRFVIVPCATAAAAALEIQHSCEVCHYTLYNLPNLQLNASHTITLAPRLICCFHVTAEEGPVRWAEGGPAPARPW